VPNQRDVQVVQAAKDSQKEDDAINRRGRGALWLGGGGFVVLTSLVLVSLLGDAFLGGFAMPHLATGVAAVTAALLAFSGVLIGLIDLIKKGSIAAQGAIGVWLGVATMILFVLILGI
jgi:hypothetical protein